MAEFSIKPVLRYMVEKNASDLYFSTGAPINMNVEGVVSAVNGQIMQPGMVHEIAYGLMNARQIDEFESTLEMNFALGLHEIGRFRVNVFRQRGDVAMVIRHIKDAVPSIESLGLPEILKTFVTRPRGLILIVGATGSGKSTTLASMIDHRNAQQTGHILTLEDPIEFVHHHKKSIVDQREVGIDTHSFEAGLKNAMRQSPNVISIGEIRDMETMKHALAYSETGHLCLATLHANNANQAIERITSFFPPEAKHIILMGLAMNIITIISQRLVAGIKAKRIAATEIMVNSPYISELIQKNKLDDLKDAMTENPESGMHSFDQSLYELYEKGLIDVENAIANADSRNDLSLRIRLAAEGRK